MKDDTERPSKRERLRRAAYRRYWKLINWQKKIFVTYLVILLCAAATLQLQDAAPLYPFNYNTLVWLLAYAFPALAVAYSLTRLRVRHGEIIDMFRPDRLWDVYFPKSRDPEIDFENYVGRRVSEHYGLLEFAGFSVLAGAFIFVGAQLIAKQFNMPSQFVTWELSGPDWAKVVGSAFLGSFAGSVLLALQRYRTFDLRPTTFLQIIAALLSGTFVGSFITIAYPWNQAPLLAFVVSFLAAINIGFMGQLLRRQFAAMTGMKLPKPQETNLREMISNDEAVEALNRMSIFSIGELSKSDPIRLYLNMPQQVWVILAYIDEAILRFYFSEVVPTLEAIHIRRFSQLLLRFHPTFKDEKLQWNDSVAVLENEKENKQLLEGVKSIVRGGMHHQLLGLLLHEYRKAYFQDVAEPAPITI